MRSWPFLGADAARPAVDSCLGRGIPELGDQDIRVDHHLAIIT